MIGRDVATAETMPRLNRRGNTHLETASEPRVAEGGWDCVAVAEHENCPEPTRWRDLKRLEAVYRKSLGALVDLHDAKRDAVKAPVSILAFRVSPSSGSSPRWGSSSR